MSVHFQTKALGKLYIHFLSFGDYADLADKTSLQEIHPEEIARRLIFFVCSPSEIRHGLPILKKDDIQKLDLEELNDFAGKFISQNPHFTHERNNVVKEKEDGSKIHSVEYKEIKYPKKGEETNIDYLKRLLQMKKAADLAQISQISQISSFSKNLQIQISETLSAGNKIKELMQGIRIPQIPEVLKVQKPSPPEHYIHIPKDHKLEMLVELSEKMDSANKNSERLIDFIVEMNKTQTMISGELKSSGDDARRFSRINLFLTIVVIGISWYSLYSDGLRGQEQAQVGKDVANQLSATLSKADEQNSRQLGTANDTLSDIADLLRQNNKKSDLIVNQLGESQDRIEALMLNFQVNKVGLDERSTK